MIDLLDTNILLYLIEHRPPQVAERVDAFMEEDSLALSFITWAELLQGAQGSQRREATLQQLDALSRQVPVLYPEGQAICHHYAEQTTALKRLGTPIGANDLWIACHCLALGASLNKLSGEEQKAAKLAAFELQINPANPGLQCHRLDNSKDKNFRSARASRDIPLIFHRIDSSGTLCCVAHHDPAYDWASRRKIETHPIPGAAQIVEIRETVREIQIPLHLPEATATPEPRRPLFNLWHSTLCAGWATPSPTPRPRLLSRRRATTSPSPSASGWLAATPSGIHWNGSSMISSDRMSALQTPRPETLPCGTPSC